MDAFQYLGSIGFSLVFVWAITGAYCWLRWGYAGVARIWSRRRELDDEVRAEVERTVLR